MSTGTFTGDASAVRQTDLDTPPPPPDRRIRLAARVLLWALIGTAVVRGLLPVRSPPAQPRTGTTGVAVASSSRGSIQDQAATATATAFLREYLTLDDRRSERPGRLGRYLARGVRLGDDVLPEQGISQTVDLAAPAGLRRAGGLIEVSVLVHLIRTRDGTSEDGGTVAFAVPMIGGGPQGVAVAGIPRPVTLPVDPGTTSRPVPLSTAVARSVTAAAGQAVAAVLNRDRPALARLGGGVAPVVRPFPTGWRPVEILEIRPAGPPDAPTAEVLVRARPPTSGIDYPVPVRVWLHSGAGTPTVREIDAGGMS
jgi:hypothetical protein